MSKDHHDEGMSILVKTVTRLTVGFILLYGIYIVTHGHVSPGGGFAGGIIVAIAFIQLILAYGKKTFVRSIPREVAALFEGMGALFFLSLALLGFTGGYFFLNVIAKGEPFRLFSAGIIPLYNIAIALKVGAGVFSVFLVLILIKNKADDQNEMTNQ